MADEKMTIAEVKAHCDAQGVTYSETSNGLTVHDMTSVSGAVRKVLDERGFIARESTPAEEPEAPTETKAASEVKQGPLPDDFPGRAALDAAGIRTYAQLRKAGDVTEIDGIGAATAAKIAEALEA